MKNKLPKTKILRVVGGEIYFQQCEIQGDNGIELYWELFRKDTSAIIKSYQETKFKAKKSIYKTPAVPSYEKTFLPVPENFATDLLAPYARLEYAKGHEPMKSFSMGPMRMR